MSMIRFAMLAALAAVLTGCASTGRSHEPKATGCELDQCHVTISKGAFMRPFVATPSELLIPSKVTVTIHWQFEEGSPYVFDSGPVSRPQDRIFFPKIIEGQTNDFRNCTVVENENSLVSVDRGRSYVCQVWRKVAALSAPYGVLFSDGERQYSVDPTIVNQTIGTNGAPPNRRVASSFRLGVCANPCTLAIDPADGSIDPSFATIPLVADALVLVWAAPVSFGFDPDADGPPDGVVWSKDGSTWVPGYVPDAINNCWFSASGDGTGSPATSRTRFFRCAVRKNAGAFPDVFYNVQYRDAQGKQQVSAGKIGR